MSGLESLKVSSYSAAPDQKQRQDLYEHLYRDVLIRKLLKTNHIPESQLQDHLYTFERWKKEMELCRSCTGLSQCKQKKRGYRMGLVYEGLLSETIAACPFEREKEQSLRHMDQYLISDMGSDMKLASFESIHAEQEEKSYNRAVMEVYQLYLDGKGAYLYGNMGTGKTWLACCASNQMAKDGKKPCFIHYPTFCDRLARLYYSDEGRREVDILGFTDFLVIDDIGAEEVTARNRMVLLSILDKRMENGRPTWFTGNGDFEMLRNHLRYDARGEDIASADRIIERIRVLAKPVLLDGADRRKAVE